MLLSQRFLPLSLMALVSSCNAYSRPQSSQQRRSLQQNTTDTENEADICDQLINDHAFWLTPNIKVYVPSAYEACIQSLPLNATQVDEHLYSLNGMFKEYYAFYNVAKDPAVCFPGEYQAELGYSLFDSQDEGKVDIATRIDDLYSKVRWKGANASIFWGIANIFTDLKDAHVQTPQLNQEFGSLLTYSMGLVPESVLNGPVIGVKTVFSLGEDGAFQLAVSKQGSLPGGSTREWTVQVQEMGGLSVTNFVLWMANSRCGNLAFQSIGARVNALLKNTWFSPQDHLFFPFVLSCTTIPSDVLGDSMNVLYSDGTIEEWHTMVFVPALDEFQTRVPFRDPISGELGTRQKFNRTGLEEILTHPGKARSNYDDMIQDEDFAWNIAFRDDRQAESPQSRKSPTMEIPAAVKQNAMDDDILFQGSINSADGNTLAAYFVNDSDDYALLKIEDFRITPDQATDIWTSLLSSAKESGVKKLMIDISGNGGGYVQGGLAFMMLMFPNVNYEWFDSHADLNYNNQMRAYLENVQPVVQGLAERIEALNDLEVADLVLAFSDESPALMFMTAGLYLTCKDNCELHPAFASSVECACPEHEALFDASDALYELYESSGSVEQAIPMFRDVLNNLTHFIAEINPWTVTQGGNRMLKSGQETIKKSVIRGGEQYYLTDQYEFLPESCDTDYPWCHDQLQAAAFDLRFQFDEYLILSDGVAGSTTSIFAAGVEQIWKNRERSLANSRVVTVAYGGTGYAEEITLAGFPASVQHVRIENPLLTRGALVILRILLSDYFNLEENTAFGDALYKASEAYTETLYIPPFFSEALPYIPVVNYYDPFMGPDAVPLQYVKMTPDEYIPTLFTKVSFADSSDLSALYQEASSFFSENDGGSISKKTPTKAGPTPKSSAHQDKSGGNPFGDSLEEAPPSGSDGLLRHACLSLLAATSVCLFLLL